jgi:hypothetical protein
MYARTLSPSSFARAMIGSNRCNDSATEQFVFVCVNVSVAAVKIDSSCIGPDPSALGKNDGMALGSAEEVFKAGLSSETGDGGGVGYAL